MQYYIYIICNCIILLYYIFRKHLFKLKIQNKISYFLCQPNNEIIQRKVIFLFE